MRWICSACVVACMGLAASHGAVAQEVSQAVVLVGAGDIANCAVGDGGGAWATSRLLDRIDGTVFTLGDNAYPDGAMKSFQECYGPRWGRHKDRTRPAPGNHDYRTKNGEPYFEYFGERAGPARRGYYSYDLGAWHIVSLNSVIDASDKSAQMAWLRDDLASSAAPCTLAYWHVPVFSSGAHGGDPHMLAIWRVLYEFKADVVVNGHDHSYERFAPQDPDGKKDPGRGIREFVVGTGGGGVYEFGRPQPHSEVRENKSYGVIKFTLAPTSYTWEFVGTGPFTDKGTAECVQ